ncbi:MAG TPA: hypothetical protein VF455_11395 [Chryseobacterium sp.]
MEDRIYIIESPSNDNLDIAQLEGDALYRALELANCDVTYKLVTSLEEFSEAFEFIIKDFYEKKGKFNAMPFIHISAHGDENGIELTNGDEVDWIDFKDELENINEKIGYILMPKGYSQTISRIVLCFSTCKGYNSFKIWNNEQKTCPFQAVVGPTDDIEWSDSMTAFIVFYHLSNNKQLSLDKAVNQMNNSSHLSNIFRLFTSPEIGKIE